MESESDGGESAPEVFDPDQVLVLTADGSADFDYPVCTLQAVESSKAAEIVLVTRCDGKLLVAVPEAAWHKKKDRRGLHPQALSKVTRVTVAGCLAGERRDPEGTPTLRL